MPSPAVVVMLVEDHDDLRYLVRFHLEQAAMVVREPDDWASLLEPGIWDGVDAAIVDLHLGAGAVTGVHVLSFLRDRVPNVRRIVFTASVLENELDPAFVEASALAHAFVSKFDLPERLVAAVTG